MTLFFILLEQEDPFSRDFSPPHNLPFKRLINPENTNVVSTSVENVIVGVSELKGFLF